MKKYIVGFICGAIIFSSITAIAISGINANQVTYTDTNNNATTVNLALDNLYNNLDSRIAMNTFGEAQYATSQGNPTLNRTTTKSITKGKYLVIMSSGEAWKDAANWSPNSGNDNWNGSFNCTSNNCVITWLSNYWNMPRATQATNGNNTIVSTTTNLFYVEIKNDTDTLSVKSGASNYNTGAQWLTIHVIPIN